MAHPRHSRKTNNPLFDPNGIPKQSQNNNLQYQNYEISVSPEFRSMQMFAANINIIRPATVIIHATPTTYSPKPIGQTTAAVNKTNSTTFRLNPAAPSFTPSHLNPQAPPFIPSEPVKPKPKPKRKVRFDLHVAFDDNIETDFRHSAANVTCSPKKDKKHEEKPISYPGVPIISSMLKDRKIAIKLLATIKALEKNLDLPGKQLQLDYQRAAAEKELEETRRHSRSTIQDIKDIVSVVEFLNKVQIDLDGLVNSVREDRETCKQAMIDQGFLCRSDGSFPGRSGESR
jgi:hypothetical protein